MSTSSGSISGDVSVAMQAAVESVLFLGLVYYIPNLMARMVTGGAGPALQAGEAIITTLVSTVAAAGMDAAAAAATPGAIGDAAGAVQAMLLR
jgi:hypothetical protein